MLPHPLPSDLKAPLQGTRILSGHVFQSSEEYQKEAIFLSIAKKKREIACRMAEKLKLTTFGGLALTRDGSSPGAAAGQRRPLAVLAMLAAAGELGVSRDKLTAVLWPDADDERGRRALAQTLYSLRKVSGESELFAGVADVKLNRDSVTADVTEFDAAIHEGRLGDAVKLYDGPFCDGFSVPGAAEFDRWLDTERTRYATRCADSLRRLIRAAQSAKDCESEIDWARRLVAIDPVDSSSALILVEALAKSGDIAAALRHGLLHEATVREQLEIPLSGPLASRLSELKRAQSAQRAETRNPEAIRSPLREKATIAPAVEPTLSSPPAPAASREISRIALPAVALIAFAAFAFLFMRGQKPVATAEAAPPMRPDAIAILPFTVQSEDRSIGFLGEGSADLMARMLTGNAGRRAVDPGAVLALLDSIPSPRRASSQSVINAHARSVSRRLGAAEVLVGRISGNARSLQLSAAVLDVKSGEERAAAEATGTADSLSSLVESLTTRLIAKATIGDDRATAFTNARFALLRSYLRAEAAYHAEDYAEAVSLYKQALGQDSSFAPAALGLALAADRMNSAEQHDLGLALAWAARDKLSERDRMYLIALAGPRYPEPSPVGEQLTAWENVVALNPDRAAAWMELGERLMYDGALLGLNNPLERAGAAFRRALELDPGDQRAKRYIIVTAVRRGDRATLEKLLASWPLSTVGGEFTGYLTWRIAIARNDRAALAKIRQRFPSLGQPSLRAIAMSSQHENIEIQDGARVLRFLDSRAVLGADKLDVLLALHSLALNQGRTTTALEITERLQDAQPGTRAHLRLRVLDALYAGGDSVAAERAAAELRTATAQVPIDKYARAVRLADLCVLAQRRAAPWRNTSMRSASDTRQLREWIREMRTAEVPSALIPVGASPHACADIAEAMLAVRDKARDARARVQRLDDVMLSGPAVGDATAWATLAIARMYEALGDDSRALAVVRQRPFMKGWPRYLAASLQTESRLSAAGE